MRKINVLHIVEDLKIGGIERIIAAIVENLDKEKYNVYVWCLARGGEIAEEIRSRGIKVEIFDMGYHCSPLFLLRLCRRMKWAKIDILHAHGHTATTVGRLAAIFARIQVILAHYHTTFEEDPRKQILIERFLSFFTDRFICCSQAVANAARKYLKIRAEKIVVIYNGVDKPALMEKIAPLEVKKEFNLSPDDYIIGCVASLTSHKGHRYLLDAAKIIDNSELSRSKTIKILLIGDGPLREDLERYSQELGISPKVIFAGIRQDIFRILSVMDIVALPSSIREGLGISLIEAMAAGKPVIGTTIGGIPEVIEPNQTGILVPPKDSQALAEAIISLLKNEEKSKRMGLAGRRLYEEKFTTEIMMQKIEDLYSSLMMEGKRSAKMEKISAALIVKDEERHIRQCLESLKWLDEIVILDGYSTDRTLEIAKEFTDKIYQKEFSGFPEERQYLLTKTSNNWVFMVDADMVIPRELREEIEEIFSKPVNEYAAFNFRFLNIYLGKEIRHCGWFDPNNARLFDKRKGAYDTRLKYIDSFIPQGKTGVAKNHILHFGFETVTEHAVRINRYSTLNAHDLYVKGYRVTGFNILWFFIIKPICIFLYKFIYRQGLLDGIEGLILSLMSAITYAISYYKLWEMQKKKV